MADEDPDGIEDVFAKELERLMAANEEVEESPPEQPESLADAFAIGTIEPSSPPLESVASDPLLAPLGPPASPPMHAVPPGPPASPPGPPPSSSQPASAPPAGAFGAPPGPPPSGPPAAPPMEAQPPGPPATPPMEAQPPGPPAAPIDLSALASEVIAEEEKTPPPPPAFPVVDSSTDHFAPPEPIVPEPTFDEVDISSWDSNWNEDWNEKADVYAKEDPLHVPEAIQDDVEWDSKTVESTETTEQNSLPSEGALKKMKKAMLVELAKLRNVPSSGTKADIIARLLA